MTTETIWLTQAAHDRLQAELTELTANATPDSDAVARVVELRATLRRAEVGDKPDDGLVEPGMTVTVLFGGDSDPTTFLLAQRGIADSDSDLDIYSPTSPLGQAITGKYPGDAFQYTAPSGTEVRGSIVAAAPFRAS